MARSLRRRFRLVRLLPAFVLVASFALNARFLFSTWPSGPGAFDAYGGLFTTLADDLEALDAAGKRGVVSPEVVPDRVRLDVSMARTLRDAAAAGERGRVPYSIGRTAGPGAALVVPAADPRGEPRRDRWGRILYRVIVPSPEP